MKKIMTFAIGMLIASVAVAKDIKTVVLTTNPQMHCEKCENKIKENLRYVKGIKTIKTDVKSQSVTVTYDADKTNVEALRASLKKVGYTATEKKANEKKAEKKAVDGTTGATGQK